MFIPTKVKEINISTLLDVRKSAYVTDIESKDVRHLQYMLKEISKYPRIRGLIEARKTALTAYDWNIISDNGTDMYDLEKRLKNYIENILNYSTDILYGSVLFKVERVNEASESGKNATLKITRIPHTEYQPIDENSFYIYDDVENINNKRIIDITSDENRNSYIYFINGDAGDIGGVMNANADNIVYLINLMPKWDELNNKLKGIILGVTDGRTLATNAQALSYGAEEVRNLQSNYNNLMKNIGKDGTENVLLTLEGIDIKLAQLVDASASHSYSLYKQELQSDIAVSLLGQANTTELPSGGGSRAALQILNMIRQDILFADINFMKRVLNRFLEIENFLSTGNSIIDYSFEFVLDDVIDTEANARKFQYLSSIGVPIEISEADFYSQLGIRKPSDDGEKITLGNRTSALMGVENPTTDNFKNAKPESEE